MCRIILLLSVMILSSSSFSQNEFAFDMYNSIEKDKNLLFSPTSIKTAFAMAYEGANNATQKEFETVFGFEEKNAKFLAEIEELKEVAEISNSIWVLENYDILESFFESIKAGFKLTPRYTNFKLDPSGSADRINTWIEKSTRGMIKNMVTSDDIQDAKMALVNAIYFKQNWKYTFDKKQTRKQDFTNSNGTKTEVDMMQSSRRFRALTGQHEQVIELPYEDDKTSMVIILPNQMNGYELNNDVYTQLISKLSYQDVNLDLPKFTFETPTFKLKDYLVRLGMTTAFENSADFSGMREENDLKIGAALHKAKIIVDEKGTEAAAATVIIMEVKTTAAMPAPIMKMTIDKPFYYFIKDNESNTILFVGRMESI